MNRLIVIDVSALVYTGSKSEWYRELESFGHPVGGIHYLMRQVSVALVSCDFVVLCFDSPSFRSKLFPDYKMGRVRDASVYSQIELLWELLPPCGVCCEKHDEYEADDIIDWVVQQAGDNYYEIQIVGNDYDLCHSIRPGVRFKSIAAGTPCIYQGNFETMADPAGYTMFNTISAKKSFCGCKSDKIPPMSVKAGLKGEELYKRFLRYIEDNNVGRRYGVLTDQRLPLIFAKNSGLFMEKEFMELVKRVRLVYPATKPENTEIVPSSKNDLNKTQLNKFLTMVGDYNSLRCMSYQKANLNDADKVVMRDKARKLRSGEYAADRNLEYRMCAAVKTLSLDAFEKEF